jgi:F420 biosynthesis protein FbiB-like protein
MVVPPRIDPEALLSIIRGRRSVRRYRPDPLDPATLRLLIEAAGWSPSPHGRQPYRFAVLTTADARMRLAAAMGARWQDQLALDGQPAEVVAKRLANSHERIRTAPAIIVPCLYLCDLDQYPDAERQAAETTMAIQSLGCAVQNMLLLAYGLGLDSGWMCAPLFCPDAVQSALGLAADVIPHALITLGYAAAEPQRRPRRAVDELIVHWE